MKMEAATIPQAHSRAQTNAALALLLATVLWGCGFTWAKSGGEAVQQAAGLPRGAPFGPVFLLAMRFLTAAAVWVIVFPASLRGWRARGLARGLVVGAFCAAGLIVQHVGLDHTSEAVSAFLTSLTILFVPLLMVVIVRKPPRGPLWAGVALASVGVWLMTGARPSGFGWGELLGLACAFLFSLYILSVNAATQYETPWRLTAAQFAVVGIICLIASLLLPGGRVLLSRTTIMQIITVPSVWLNLSLLALFPTLIAFGLLTFYQPRIDPTRAALIYLAEPIFAAIYAAIAAGHRIGRLGLLGAGLILVANALVEVLGARRREEPEERVVLVD